MNKAILMGRLTKDPELKTTPSGTNVVSFSLAVQRRFKNANGEYEADFINCVAWKGTAEFISKFFSKGQQIGCVGSIQTRKYQAPNGENRSVTEVLVEEAYFCGDKEKTAVNPNVVPNTPPAVAEGFIPMPPSDEDLPF